MAIQSASVQWFKLTDDQKRKDLWTALNAKKTNLFSLLPAGVSPERMLLTAFNSITKNPKLLQCRKETIVLSIIQAFELGLEPDTPEQLAHLIPFKDECKLMTGYRGLLKLAGEQKGVAFIDANIVYEKDTFEIDLGVNQNIVHKPHIGQDRGSILLVYSVVWYTDARKPKLDYMLKHEVDAIKNGSRGKDEAPWTKHYSEQAKKTMLRRACKSLTGNARLAKALEIENSADSGEATLIEGEAQNILIGAMAGQEGDPSAPAAEKLASRLTSSASTTVDEEVRQREPGEDD